MKKSLNALLALTILSGCSLFSDDNANKVTGSKHAPALNGSGMNADPAPSPSSMMMPPMSPSSSSAAPQIPEPPSFGKDDYVSNPALAQSGTPTPAASQGDRRPPELNRAMMGGSSPSGDLVAASPTPGISQSNMMPTPPAPPEQMPQGDLQLPPPPPVMASGKDSYPRLADVPQAPQAPTPAAQDPRVAQMKQDLADMDRQQANFQSSGNRTSIKGVGSAGGGAVPVVETQTPRKAGNDKNQPSLVAQSPADPYLANAQTQAPQIPEPPQFNSAGQPVSQPQMPQQMASRSMPQPAIDQNAIMPKGPTVVVHSKNPGARPYNPQTAMATPPMQNSGMAPMPPAPVQAQPLPPTNMQASAQKPGSFTRAPSMRKAPSTLGGSAPQNSQPSTSVSQLRPIPVEAPQTYAANSGDAPDGNSFNPNGLQPIPTNNIRILPASRYSSLREGARDGSGY